MNQQNLLNLVESLEKYKGTADKKPAIKVQIKLFVLNTKSKDIHFKHFSYTILFD